MILQAGPCRVGIESTILDMTGEVPMILRPGMITPEEITKCIGQKVVYDPALLTSSAVKDAEAPKPRAPGMKYRHYAPKAEMVLFQGERQAVEETIRKRQRQEEASGKKVGVLLFEGEDAGLVARHFFSRLREMDASGVDLILAAALDQGDPVGFSVMNRMLKSAGYRVEEV